VPQRAPALGAQDAVQLDVRGATALHRMLLEAAERFGLTAGGNDGPDDFRAERRPAPPRPQRRTPTSRGAQHRSRQNWHPARHPQDPATTPSPRRRPHCPQTHTPTPIWRFNTPSGPETRRQLGPRGSSASMPFRISAMTTVGVVRARRSVHSRSRRGDSCSRLTRPGRSARSSPPRDEERQLGRDGSIHPELMRLTSRRHRMSFRRGRGSKHGRGPWHCDDSHRPEASLDVKLRLAGR
jgi:hypothetical protein